MCGAPVFPSLSLSPNHIHTYISNDRSVWHGIIIRAVCQPVPDLGMEYLVLVEERGVA